MFERKYGAGDSVEFSLYAPDGVDFIDGAAFAAGDVKISIDGGAYTNTTNLPSAVTGGGYTLTLTAAELTGKKIKIRIVDQTATKVWLDRDLDVETYGNANAQHQFDRSATYVAPDNAGIASNGVDIAANLTAIAAMQGDVTKLLSGKIRRNQPFSNFEFPMRDSSNVLTSGLSVTGTKSIDGAAPVAISGSFSEVGGGLYSVNLLAADTNGTVIIYKFSAIGANDTVAGVITTS